MTHVSGGGKHLTPGGRERTRERGKSKSKASSSRASRSPARSGDLFWALDEKMGASKIAAALISFAPGLFSSSLLSFSILECSCQERMPCKGGRRTSSFPSAYTYVCPVSERRTLGRGDLGIFFLVWGLEIERSRGPCGQEVSVFG